jgi:hypothetical protein
MARRLLFLLSLALAALSTSARWIVGGFATNPAAFVLVIVLSAIPWLVILGVSVYKYGRQGYWVLLGAPLVLYWPIIFVWAYFGCFVGEANCT